MLIIDNRENKLIALFQQQQGAVDHKVEPLDIGDILIKVEYEGVVNEVYIERKTLSDLESSIKDGRYSEQKCRMKSNCPHCIYLIECYECFDKLNPMCKGSIINTLLRDKMQIIFSKDLQDTYVVINEIYKRVLSNPEKYFSSEDKNIYLQKSLVKKKKCGNINKHSIFIKQLSLIPGISYIKAKAIVDSSNTSSIYELAQKIKGGEFKLSSVPSIGAKLDSSIKSFII